MNSVLDFLKQQEGKDAASSPSPLMRWLNPILISAEAGKLCLQYKIRNEWTNPMQILHGGATAAIIDDAIGVTAMSISEEYYFATINLTIDYLSSAKENDIIIAETSLIKKGRQLMNVRCEVWNADKSRLIAIGNSNLLKTEVRI